jgi:hypothetical protein
MTPAAVSESLIEALLEYFVGGTWLKCGGRIRRSARHGLTLQQLHTLNARSDNQSVRRGSIPLLEPGH